MQYERQVRLHIAPTLGPQHADEIKPMHLEAFYRGLPLSVALSSHTVLPQAYDWAILNELIARPANPARVARPRRGGTAGADPDLHNDALVRPVDPKAVPIAPEIELLLEDAVARGRERWWLYLAIAPCAGARPGEMGALQRHDLEFDEHTLRIVREANKHAGRITRVKSVHSERVLYLGPDLFADIAPVTKHMAPDDYLFPADDRMRFGRPVRLPCWSANGIGRRLKAACKRAGLRHYAPHSFRHFCATQLLAAGMPPSQVARFLGHANDYMVRTLYGRWIVEEAQRAIGLAAGTLIKRTPPAALLDIHEEEDR